MMLDRSRPFGTVYGGGDHAFEQDGNYFDHEGNETGAPKGPKEPKAVRKQPTATVEALEDSELAAQLKG